MYLKNLVLLMLTALLQGLWRLAAQFEQGVSISINSINIRSIFAIVSGSRIASTSG
jgi:hypothetical protein